MYLPLRTKIFQTIEIYLTGGCGEDLIFRRCFQCGTSLSSSKIMKTSFYVALTSDKSLEQFPQNKAAEFKMQLPRQMHQSENWEVAMTAERAA